jgi:hypothetical protein
MIQMCRFQSIVFIPLGMPGGTTPSPPYPRQQLNIQLGDIYQCGDSVRNSLRLKYEFEIERDAKPKMEITDSAY